MERVHHQILVRFQGFQIRVISIFFREFLWLWDNSGRGGACGLSLGANASNLVFLDIRVSHSEWFQGRFLPSKVSRKVSRPYFQGGLRSASRCAKSGS